MKPEYLFNPELKFLREGYSGNVLQKKRFVNEDHQFGAGFSQVLRWMVSKNPQRAEKKRSLYHLDPEPGYSIFKDGPDAFAWLGHASFLFRINNKRILTDPCLYDLPGIHRQFASPFRTNELDNIDYILLSHSHRDHFDTRSMKEILKASPEAMVYCPLKMSGMVRAVGGKHIVEAGWYQEYPADASGIRFAFLPSKHWNRRYMHDTNRELWGAFWIGSQHQSIYFAGDTAYHSHFADAQKILPPLKHAFLPIGAYKPGYMMKGSHTSPEEAIQAFHDLHAEIFVPMHYGTYDLSDEPLSEPMEILTQKLAHEKLIAPVVVPGHVYTL